MKNKDSITSWQQKAVSRSVIIKEKNKTISKPSLTYILLSQKLRNIFAKKKI